MIKPLGNVLRSLRRSLSGRAKSLEQAISGRSTAIIHSPRVVAGGF